MKNPINNLLLEKAVKFLVSSVERSGKNPKPVIIHSLRVALNLDALKEHADVVVAALLHDLVEDTSVTLDEIKSIFGDEVARLVSALTFDQSISDKRERYIEGFIRCHRAGRIALIIRVADILDNSDYYLLAEDKKTYTFLLEKMKYFLDLSRTTISSDPLWKELSKKYSLLHKSTLPTPKT